MLDSIIIVRVMQGTVADFGLDTVSSVIVNFIYSIISAVWSSTLVLGIGRCARPVTTGRSGQRAELTLVLHTYVPVAKLFRDSACSTFA
jgi:hypothetical protein